MPWTPPRDNCDGNDDSGDNDDGDEDEDEDEDDDEATQQGSLRRPDRQTHTQGTYCQPHCSELGVVIMLFFLGRLGWRISGMCKFVCWVARFQGRVNLCIVF